MQTVRVRINALELEAKRIFEILGAAFEDEGLPVTIYELVPWEPEWVVEVLMFDVEPDEAISQVRDRLGADAFAAPIEAEILAEDTNWVAKSLEGLTPVEAGRFFVHGAHDRDKRPFHGHSIEVEAALAFGTGHHGTTVGCLVELERVLERGNYFSILDLGTGTGVLAIAAALMTRRKVIATDIDPVAAQAAGENARRNGVGALVKTFTAAGVDDRRFAEHGPYDLIVANILARPLMRLAAPISRRMTRDAVLILSGLREMDRARIVFAYQTQGFHLARSRCRDGWLTLTFARGKACP